jgi:hypothetical protein
MQQEQQNYFYEVLQWGRYIHPKITKLIQAHNDSSGLYRPVKLVGLYITMDNEKLWELILRIVRPTTTEEWLLIFHSLVKFTPLPQGYILDITKYDFFYIAIIEFLFLLKKVIKFLDWNAPEKFSPALRTKDGRIGYMEIIWKKIPTPLGEKLHLGLSSHQLRECSDISEYLSYFSQQSQKIYDDSKTAKKNRLRYEGNSALNADGDINHKSVAVTGKFQSNPKLNYMNALAPNPLMLLDNPYHSDERSELPNRSHDFLKPDHSNRYNSLTDENVNDFDYYDMSIDNPSTNQSMLNPLYHHTNDSTDKFQTPYTESDQVGTNLSTNLHMIDNNKMKSLPCFEALIGTCRDGNACKFSHEKSLLQATYDKKMLQLSCSPFAKNHKAASFSDSRQNSNWKSPSLGDSRHTVGFPTSPFTCS